MVQVDSRMRRYGGVTLVEVVVTNDGQVARQVRIASELDGAVWPPRTQGVPETEWDGETLAVCVDPGERRSVGFASPATPVDPPVRVESERALADGGSVTPAAVVRTLGDPRPPRDAVSSPERRGEDGSRGTDDGDRKRAGADASGEQHGVCDPATATTAPPAVRAWLTAVERGIAGADPAADHLVEPPDPTVLRAIAGRAERLADRIEGTATQEGAKDGDRERAAGETA